MRLRTLGELSLEGVTFKRAKPLLLLSYLAVEGTKERWLLRELFWRGATNAQRSLSTALAQRAYLLAGAPEPEPEELERSYVLLRAGSQVRNEQQAIETGGTIWQWIRHRHFTLEDPQCLCLLAANDMDGGVIETLAAGGHPHQFA